MDDLFQFVNSTNSKQLVHSGIWLVC